MFFIINFFWFYTLKRFLLQIFVIVSLSLLVLFFVGKAISLKTSKSKLEIMLSDKTNSEVDILGKVNFKVFPLPHVEISHLRISNLKKGIFNLNIRATSALLYPEILSLFSDNINARQVDFSNAKLNFNLINLSSYDHSNVSEIPDFISFKDSSLEITNDNYNLFKTFDDLDFTISKEQDNFVINSNFKSKLNNYQIKSIIKKEANNITEISSTINSANNIFKISSTLNNEKSELIGDIQIDGDDLQEFVFNYLYRSPYFFPDNRKNNFRFDSSFEISNEGLKLNNIKINSKIMKAHGNLTIPKDAKSVLNINLDEFFISELLTIESNTQVNQSIKKLGKDDQLTFSMPSNGLFTVNLISKNLNFKNHYLQNVKGEFFINNDNRKTFNLLFNHSNNNIIDIKGELINNSIKGNIKGNGSNLKDIIESFNFKLNTIDKDAFSVFNFFAEYELGQNKLVLDNINFSFDNTNLNGAVSINNSSDSNISNIHFDVDDINFDKYLIKDFNNTTRNIFDSIYGSISKDSDNRSLFQKFLWLRDINNKINFQLNFNSFKLNNIINENTHLDGEINYRYFAINNFKILNENNNFNSSFTLDISDINPNIKINLDGELFDVSFLSSNKTDKTWSKDYFRIPDFTNLPVDIEFNIKNFKFNKLSLSNVIHKSRVIEGVLYIDNFTGKIFDIGEFKVDGNYIVSGVPTLNLAIIFTKLQFHKLTDFLFDFDRLQTTGNMTLKINTFGQNMPMFFKQLKTDINLATNVITLKDYNVKNVIQYIADLSNFEKNLPPYDLDSLLANGDFIFNPLQLKLNIRKGKIKLDNISLDSQISKSIFSGVIDFHNQEMAFTNLNLFRSYYRSGEEVLNEMLRFDKIYKGYLFQPEYILKDTQVKNFVSGIKTHVDSILNNKKNN